MTDRSFPRTRRVRRQQDFDRVFAGKIYAADDMLVLNACGNGLSYTRLGLSMSRKVGNAVVRNRWKRVIREAFRHQQKELPAGLDLVVRPRRGARPDYHEICRSLVHLCRRVAQRAREAKR